MRRQVLLRSQVRIELLEWETFLADWTSDGAESTFVGLMFGMLLKGKFHLAKVADDRAFGAVGQFVGGAGQRLNLAGGATQDAQGAGNTIVFREVSSW